MRKVLPGASRLAAAAAVLTTALLAPETPAAPCFAGLGDLPAAGVPGG